MVLKGSYMAQNKSQPSRGQESKAEPSKAEPSGEAGDEIKTQQTHSSCHLTLYRLTARRLYSHNPKHSICTPTALQPFCSSE